MLAEHTCLPGTTVLTSRMVVILEYENCVAAVLVQKKPG